MSIVVALTTLMPNLSSRVRADEVLSAAQVFSQSAVSVVQIETDYADGSVATGSGFAVLVDGYPLIVTCDHVITGAKYLRVGVQEDALFDVTECWPAPSKDLAVLKVPDGLGTLPTLPLRTTPIQVGEIVYAIGFPLSLGKSITQGIVSTSYGSVLQFDAPISSGNSGGPLIESTGHVIGIVARGSTPSGESIIQNLNFGPLS